MKTIVKTDEYTIVQKRNSRYAVRDSNRNWVNGDAKAAILAEHKLIADAPKAAPPESEPVEAAAEAVEDSSAADAASTDATESGAADGAADAG